MEENDFAKQNIAPEDGISRSSFSEIMNGRGLEQLQFVFENLYKQALKVLPKEHKALLVYTLFRCLMHLEIFPSGVCSRI